MPKLDSGDAIEQHMQDMGIGLAAATQEQMTAIRAGVRLDDILKVFEQGDGTAIRTI